MMIDSVREFFERNNINNCNITVALSGGKDSVSLLCALLELKDEYSLSLTAAHLNHNLRGDESLRDECFVKNLCKKYGVQLFLESLPIADIARTHHKGIEETARKCRYDFLQRVSTGYIATAHNKEDNAETVILNIIRGTGVQGLCGIEQVDGNIIRPLLDVSKDEILQYLSQKGQDFVTDSTNCDTSYSRNRVRGTILPQMQEINPDTVGAVLRLSAIADEYENHIVSEAKALCDKAKVENGYDAKVIAQADKCLRRKAISIIIAEHIKQNVSYIHINMADEILQSGGRLNLPENLFFTVKDNILKIEKSVKSQQAMFCYDYDLTDCDFDKFSITCHEITRQEFDNLKKVNNLAKFILLDYDKIPKDLYLRSRRQGDYFKPFGKSGKSLKKLFIDEKIPLYKRDDIVVLSDADRIIGVEGFGASQDFGVSGDSAKIIKIEIKR